MREFLYPHYQSIALFKVNFSHLYYDVIQHGCKAISGQKYKIARICFAQMLDFIVMQLRKANREKDYWKMYYMACTESCFESGSLNTNALAWASYMVPLKKTLKAVHCAWHAKICQCSSKWSLHQIIQSWRKSESFFCYFIFWYFYSLPSLHSRHFLSFSRRRYLISERSSEGVWLGWTQNEVKWEGVSKKGHWVRGFLSLISIPPPVPYFLQSLAMLYFLGDACYTGYPLPSPCTNMQ